MAKIEALIERQHKRLAKAKQELADSAEGKAIRVIKARIAQHNRNIIRLEGRAVRKAHAGQAKPSGGSRDFYASTLWRQLRYKVLVAHGRRCVCCGASPETGAVLHVDHIKPRSTHPELALDITNMQVLCEVCNLGKSNLDDTDFR